jgi:hypothetical protein
MGYKDYMSAAMPHLMVEKRSRSATERVVVKIERWLRKLWHKRRPLMVLVLMVQT